MMMASMSGMIIKLLQTSLIMSAAILLLAVLSRLLHRKTPAAVRMACWLIVACGLLIPVRPPLYTLTMPEFVSAIADTVSDRLEGRAGPVQMTDQTGETVQMPQTAPDADTSAQTPSGSEPVKAGPSAEWAQADVAVLVLYLLGFLTVVTICAVKHIRFLRLVRRWEQPVSDAVSHLMDDVKREIGLIRQIRLLSSPVITTPVLVGLFRPAIVLPGEAIEDTKLRFILMHEALHCKRGDIWAKTLSLLAVATHWFNPFVYLMHHALVTESEAACDMAVLRHSGMDRRFQYGETILFIAGRGKQTKATLTSAFCNRGRGLKKRLNDIVERAIPKRWVSVCCAVVLFLGLLPAGLTGFTIRSGAGMDGNSGDLSVRNEASEVSGSRTDTPGGLPGLKDIYQDYFPLGTCGGVNTLTDRDLELVTRHFNVFTFENEMKPQYIQSEEGKFDFSAVDGIAAKLRKHNMAAVGHTLVWHQQTKSWMWDSAEKAKERLEAHIDAVIRHSGPYLTSIDVVNEAMADGGAGTDWRADLRDEGWYSVLGADYIEIAFRKADEVRREIGRPDLKLYYNDYGLNTKKKADAVYAMVTELRAKGVPIDGIGMQSHYDESVNPDDVRRTLEVFNTISGVEVSISELDIAISSSLGNPSLTAEEDTWQGTLYARLFSLYKEYAQGSANPDASKRLITRVTVWGTTDDTAWRGNRNPLLFDRRFEAKGAYYAVADPEAYLDALT